MVDLSSTAPGKITGGAMLTDKVIVLVEMTPGAPTINVTMLSPKSGGVPLMTPVAPSTVMPGGRPKAPKLVGFPEAAICEVAVTTFKAGKPRALLVRPIVIDPAPFVMLMPVPAVSVDFANVLPVVLPMSN